MALTFCIGDRVKRRTDNVEQTIYYMDTIKRVIHVNWLNSKQELLTETHQVPNDLTKAPVILVKAVARKRE